MKFELDLFGQVPISRLELKRKLRSDGDLTVDNAIREIIAQKLEGTFTIASKYKKPRRFNSPQEKITLQTLKKYLAMCQLKTAYQAYLARIKKEVKHRIKADLMFLKQIDLAKELDALQQEAYTLIAQLTRTSNTFDKLLAKRAGKRYHPRKRILTAKHVKFLKQAQINPELIPWQLATATAKDCAQKLGIYAAPLDINPHFYETKRVA